MYSRSTKEIFLIELKSKILNKNFNFALKVQFEAKAIRPQKI
jgi:hypothetical protein